MCNSTNLSLVHWKVTVCQFLRTEIIQIFSFAPICVLQDCMAELKRAKLLVPPRAKAMEFPQRPFGIMMKPNLDQLIGRRTGDKTVLNSVQTIPSSPNHTDKNPVETLSVNEEYVKQAERDKNIPALYDRSTGHLQGSGLLHKIDAQHDSRNSYSERDSRYSTASSNYADAHSRQSVGDEDRDTSFSRHSYDESRDGIVVIREKEMSPTRSEYDNMSDHYQDGYYNTQLTNHDPSCDVQSHSVQPSGKYVTCVEINDFTSFVQDTSSFKSEVPINQLPYAPAEAGVKRREGTPDFIDALQEFNQEYQTLTKQRYAANTSQVAPLNSKGYPDELIKQTAL